ncbi:MFS transporter [Alicyclobacillus acidiphilus]|uniref:MFS transporter n=1 Tax=Alicyclobacillus acidiphilus TaxID=182455 RepID=UPI00082E4CA9|nr:MFS transporter [Alicyclobacillus acidiphilus]
MRQKSWYLVLVLFVVSTSLRPAITSIGPLMTQIQQHLQMNALTASLLTSIPVFCMGVFAPLTSSVGLRFGINRAILYCVILIGLATGARVFTDASVALLVTAFAAGVGIAVIGPLLSGFIKEHFPDQAPTMIGIYSLGIGVGATISAGLSIPISTALSSWNGALAVWAILSLIGLFMWLPVLTPRPDRPDVLRNGVRRRGLPWGEGRAWLLLVAFGLQSGVYYSVTTWLAPQAEELGYTAATAGMVLTTFSLIQMVSSLIIPIFINRSRSRTPWLVLSCVATVIGLSVCGFWNGPAGPWVADVFLGVGLGGLFPILLILPLDETSNGEDASRWTAMMQCGGYIISGVVPMLAGAIKDVYGQYRFSFEALDILALALLVTSFFLAPGRARGTRSGSR